MGKDGSLDMTSDEYEECGVPRWDSDRYEGVPDVARDRKRDIQGLATLEGVEQEVMIEEAKGDDGLCEYERIRANNIRQREALFASLDFRSAKSGLSPRRKKPTLARDSVRQRPVASSEDEEDAAVREETGKKREKARGTKRRQPDRSRNDFYMDDDLAEWCSPHLHGALAPPSPVGESDEEELHTDPTTCKICDRDCHTQRYLRAHVKAVHNEATFPCSKCSHVYKTAYNMRRHALAAHLGIRFPRNLCTYRAPDKGSLRRHEVRVHEAHGGAATA